jgi:hypothetical protein
MMALLREIHGRQFTPSDHSPCVLEPGVRCLESYGTAVEGESDAKVSSSQSPLSLSLSTLNLVSPIHVVVECSRCRSENRGRGESG